MTTKIEQALAIVRDSHQPKLAAFLQAGPSQEARETMAEQLLEFETQYPGGLVSYSHKIIKLMDEYVKNITKYDDVKLNTPATISLNWNELDLIRKSDPRFVP